MRGALSSVADGLNISRYSDWLVFVKRLKELVHSGRARKIEPLKRVFAKGEEWYLDTGAGDIYVYVSPDAPILPIWERVDVFASEQVAAVSANDLSVVPLGTMEHSEAQNLKTVLSVLAGHGVVERLIPDNVGEPHDFVQAWYKDVATGTVYRLIEKNGEDSKWERVPRIELKANIQ